MKPARFNGRFLWPVKAMRAELNQLARPKRLKRANSILINAFYFSFSLKGLEKSSAD